jgi:hypothetical protein
MRERKQMTDFDDHCLSDLSPDEEQALKAYKAASWPSGVGTSSPCFDMNRELRSGLQPREIDPQLRGIVDALDRMFVRCPRLSREVVVHRAIGTRLHLPVHEVGKRFRSLEFWSTATSDARVDSFLTPISNKNNRGAILDLTLPAGVPAYNMETLPDFGGHEAELLLPRGILWTVDRFVMIPHDELSPPVQRDFENVARVALTATSW